MTLADLTDTQLLFVTLISVGVAYLVAKSIDRLQENYNADKRRR